MNKMLEFMLLIALLFTVGCMPVSAVQQGVPPLVDGDVIAVQATTAVRGITAALQSQPFTTVLRKGDIVLLGWPGPGNTYGFACWKCDGDPVTLFKTLAQGKANLATSKTFSDFVNALKGAGFSEINPAEVYGVQTIQAWVISAASSFPTILIMPVQFLIPEDAVIKS